MRKKNGNPGNSRLDREWIKEHSDSLVAIDDGDFEGLLQWDGTEESMGSAWTLPRDKNRCAAWAYIRDADGNYIVDSEGHRLRRPCYSWRIKGTNICLRHGGGLPVVRRKATERLVAAADSVAGVLLGIVNNNKATDRDRIAAANSLLDRAGLKGGAEAIVVTPKYAGVWNELAKVADMAKDGKDDDE